MSEARGWVWVWSMDKGWVQWEARGLVVLGQMPRFGLVQIPWDWLGLRQVGGVDRGRRCEGVKQKFSM